MQKLLDFKRMSEEQMRQASREFMQKITQRRTVRDFSDKSVPKEIIENAVRCAASAPSGANKQPWHFVIISNPAVKRQIRIGAEKEEAEFYAGKAPESWLKDLEVFETDEHKPFLETAPYLIAVFLERYHLTEDGEKQKNYYMPESVGIATGMLLTALHLSGLATLTHTPSPMKFLNQILQRPSNEKPTMLIVAGYPEEGATVPEITKKKFQQIASHF